MRFKEIDARSLVMTERSFWPNRILRQFVFLPAPLAGHVAQTVESFTKTCGAVGLLSSRIRFDKSPFRDFYTCDHHRAWTPPAGLQMMSRHLSASADGQSDDALRQRMRKRMSKLKRLETRLHALRTGLLDSALDERDFDSILAHPLVKAVRAIIPDEQCIEVTTSTVYISYGGEQYRIGSFRILVPVSGPHYCDNTMGVRMFNRNGRTPDGYNHPHVDRVGKPCLGNVIGYMKCSLEERKIPDAVFVCIKFLQSYTREDRYDPFRPIEEWPKVGD